VVVVREVQEKEGGTEGINQGIVGGNPDGSVGHGRTHRMTESKWKGGRRRPKPLQKKPGGGLWKKKKR